MPAAAVIPAPIAYIKVVVVKKLVVGSQLARVGPPCRWLLARRALCRDVLWCSSPSVAGGRHVYFEKIRVLKAGLCA